MNTGASGPSGAPMINRTQAVPTTTMPLRGYTWGANGVNTYINRRTEQAQQESTNASDRIHSNPYHQPTALLTRGGLRGHHTPNFQLGTLGDGSNDTPLRGAQWSKMEIQTPLNRMRRGNTVNWAQTADSVTVKLPLSTPFPKDKKKTLKRSLEVLDSIPEDTPGDELELSREAKSPIIMGPEASSTQLQAYAKTIALTDPALLTREDISTDGSSDGVTATVAVILNHIKVQILPGATIPQLHNLAHFLLTTNLDELLKLRKDKDELDRFVTDRLRIRASLPPLLEHSLCPTITGCLIVDQKLRARMDAGTTATKEDRINCIMPFVRRFYPTAVNKVEQLLWGGKFDRELPDIIQTPGYFAQLWTAADGIRYDPPRWIDYAPSIDESTSPKAHDMTGTGSFDDDENYVSLLDGFTPIHHLGIPVEAVSNLTPTEQKNRALQTLPALLKQLTTTETAADILIRLATIPDNEFPHYLQADGFRECLHAVEQIGDGTPDQREYYRAKIRIRRQEQVDFQDKGNELITHEWLQAASALAKAVDFSLTIIASPSDPITAGRHINQEVPASNDLDSFIHTVKGQTGTFDIWCITTDVTWGDDTEVCTLPPGIDKDTYYSTLTAIGIMVSREEAYPADLSPCVALIGSDSKDRNDIIKSEFAQRLEAIQAVGIDFDIIWCSLHASTRTVMVKCIATTSANWEMVATAFQRVKTATVTAFYPTTNNLSMYFLPNPELPVDTQTLTTIIMTQQTYEDEMTCVALTGLNKLDPHAVYPKDKNGKRSKLTMAEKILLGLKKRSDGITEHSAAYKVTTDSTFSRCYLTAPKENAQELIDYARRLAPVFKRWVGRNATVHVLSAEAEHWIPKSTPPPPPVTTISSGDTTLSTISGITSSITTLGSRLEDRFDKMFQMITTQSQTITTLHNRLEEAEKRALTQTSMINVLQTTLSTTLTELTNLTAAKRMDQVLPPSALHTDLVDALDKAALMARSDRREMMVLMLTLIDKYEQAATETNDCTMAFGTEIALLRVFVDGCMDRVNWLVEDLGSNTAGKPTPPRGDRLSTRGITTIINAVQEIYNEGGDVTNPTAVVDKCVEATRSSPTTTQPNGEDPMASGEGRQRGRATKLDGPQPEEEASLPLPTNTTIPDTEDDGTTTAMDTPPGDGNKRGAMGETGTQQMVDVSQPSGPHGATKTPEHDLGTQPLEAHRRGINGVCSCCTKESTSLQLCDPCGQYFHEDCITYNNAQKTMLCKQCEEDQAMFVVKEDSSNTDTTTERTNTLNTQPPTHTSDQSRASSGRASESSDSSDSSSSGDDSGTSSFSRASIKRRRRSLLRTPTKHSKMKSNSTVQTTLMDESSDTTPTTTDTTTAAPIRAKPGTTDTSTKKSVQATLSQRPDTGTIQLQRNTPTPPAIVRRTRAQTNSLPQQK